MFFLLGGFNVKITAESFSISEFFSEIPQAFMSSKQVLASAQNIYINFSFVQHDDFQLVNKKILFHDNRFVLCKTATNSIQLFCYDESERNLRWILTTDVDFLKFNYEISTEILKNESLIEKYVYSLVVNRFLYQHTFINHHGLIIHAAGGSINGKGMVFPAISGTGKSTLSHLLLPYPENQLFSEERIIMRRLDDGWHLWGTPWKGSGVIARNESAPLSALVFLSQAQETKISKLPPSAALRRLLETVSIPWYSQEWTDKGLAVCESLLRAIPAYELAFRPDQTAVQAVAELAASLD